MIAEVSPASTRRPGAEPPLITRARQGDPDAWAALYNENHRTVWSFVYWRTDSRALAEDIVSETFLRAFRRINTFTWTGRDVGAWLVTIARNLIADHYKSSRVRWEWPTSEMLDSDEVEFSAEHITVSRISRRLTAELVAEAMRGLTEGQRTVLHLRFWQGLTVTETARAMGMREGAAKTMQYRAVRRLQESLRGAGVVRFADVEMAVAA